MNKRGPLFYAWLLVASCLLTSAAFGQPETSGTSTLDAAKEISAASGRPIFAIAGSHT